MNLLNIIEMLQDNFDKELKDGKKRHIVFWYDNGAEFEDDIDDIKLNNVKIIKINDNNAFHTKYLIEKEDTTSNYLIYINKAKPSAKLNWFLDILKYSIEFSPDKTDEIMRNLGANNEVIRNLFKNYSKFFGDKKRYAKLESYKISDFTEKTMHEAVISVLCGQDISNFEESVIRLLEHEINVIRFAEIENKYMQNIIKFGDVNAFWDLAERFFGYTSLDPSFNELMIHIFVNYFNHNFEEEKLPKDWAKYVSNTKFNNCIVFMNHIINDEKRKELFNEYSKILQDELRVEKYIYSWDISEYITNDTFEIFDQSIINHITNGIISGGKSFEEYKNTILARRKTCRYKDFKNEYDAIVHAINLLDLCEKYEMAYVDSYSFIQKYVNQYYEIDRSYRKFYNCFDKITYSNQDCFDRLQETIENVYSNKFISDIAIKWSTTCEELDDNWKIPGIVSQDEFYNKYINNFVNKNERAFLIISDGLRYETASELAQIIDINKKGTVEIAYMQGSIPSYTPLGMAALLPHEQITLINKNEKIDFLVDGMNCSSTDDRGKILAKYSNESLAIQFNELVKMKKAEWKELFSGKKLVYIYHNEIDNVGESMNEDDIFDACERTISSIKILIDDLVKTVSATNIFVTSDHGFIYKRGTVIKAHKVKEDMCEYDIEKKRFGITSSNDKTDSTLRFSLDYILGKDCGLNVLTPRGANIFQTRGSGLNYVHGGAMLQEIVIPVIKFKNDKGKNANEVKKVDVKLTSISRKITNMITYFEFLQTEKVENKNIPLRLKLYLIDQDETRISNDAIIIADNISANTDERKYKEKLVLKNMKYDKSKNYWLVLEDDEKSIESEIERIPFIIDIAIQDDFGF